MRFFLFALGVGVSLLADGPAGAQVDDAERAAARDLFKQGDELQREARFAEALDRFQRAQQIYNAPTNLLRIAECQAALGRLVESAEAFRAVARTSLGPASPPAFQVAIDQAKAELEQVEPRVPRVVLQVLPAGISNAELQLDGRRAPVALIGEPLPLDPGRHKVALLAAGYVGAEESFVLRERETRVVQLALRQVRPPPSALPVPQPAPASQASPPEPRVASAPTAVPERLAPPPPAVMYLEPAGAPRPSLSGVLLGAHLGASGLGGLLPTDSGSIEASDVVGPGVAAGLDAAYRFGRRWCVGLSLEHANFGAGTEQSGAPSSAHASATLLAIILGVMVNPDKTSFYGEVGLASRWLAYATPNQPASTVTHNAGEFSLGAGVWVPAGRSFRLLPKVTLGLGTFDRSAGLQSGDLPHAFLTVGLSGLYNLDF